MAVAADDEVVVQGDAQVFRRRHGKEPSLVGGGEYFIAAFT
jgi:hypothetical protein